MSDDIQRPAPGDQLVAFADNLIADLYRRGLIEMVRDPATPGGMVTRLTKAGCAAAGDRPGTGRKDGDLVELLHRLARACELEVPGVP